MGEIRLRYTCDVRGIVQGVGFRPTLYRLATMAGLAGSVQNRAGSVQLVLEGTSEIVERFLQDLRGHLPANARIDSLAIVERAPIPPSETLNGFAILESGTGHDVDVIIPADLVVCPDCLREIHDPRNRRYGYPFATCTLCGPRYTVLASMPYDRSRTSLAAFPMCPDCEREYHDVHDRRFHCETIACPRCGPRLSLEDLNGSTVTQGALAAARAALAQGSIVAVRGIGGFLLAADAFSRPTIEELRRRKNRPHKPFAVMASDLETLRRYCLVPDTAADLLISPEGPIVILDVRDDPTAAACLPLDLIAPDAPTLGAMLPTSPLHHLLMHPLAGDPTPAFDLLIMTSGNRRGEPTSITNEDARTRLRDVADLLLCHDREINLRNDDSLCVLQRNRPQVWRRSRGYAPQPIRLPRPVDRCTLAMGAELKNTIALAYDDRAVISPHVGDLDTPEAVLGLEQVVRALPLFLGKSPRAVAIDLHPDMQSSILGRRLAKQLDIPLIEVQHHHAHGAACLIESELESGLALVMDGSGLGPDGAIWGSELLHITPSGSRRLACFSGVPLPGGDAAVRHPARQLIGRWVDAGTVVSPFWLARLGITPEEVTAWTAQCRSGVNTPWTHGAGRLFDAFASLLGLAPPVMTYEGQPAIRLEASARRARGVPSPVPFRAAERDGLLQIDWREAFRAWHDNPPSEERRGECAMGVHVAVAEAALAMVKFGLEVAGRNSVALSGGVFMNRVLNDLLVPEIEKLGVECLVHTHTPPNDGCIALGQVVVGGRQA